MASKLDKSNDYPLNIIVKYAVSAKNAQHNCFGYSTNQSLFGQNPNVRSRLIHKVSAVEGEASSEIIAEKFECYVCTTQILY